MSKIIIISHEQSEIFQIIRIKCNTIQNRENMLVARRVPLVQQELRTISEDMSSSGFLPGFVLRDI